MRRQVHRAEVADGDLGLVGVQRDLGAKIGAMHNANVLLRRTDVARILEGDPWVSSLEQHREHLAPEVVRLHFLEQLHFAGGATCLIAQVGFLELLAIQVVQIRHIGGREQRPFALLHDALHEQIRNPVRGVHVMRTAAIIAGVLAQIEELLDIHVPSLEIGANRALTLTTLVDRDRGIVHDLQERHNALRLAISAFDMSTERAHWRPVIAQTTCVLGEQSVFFDCLVNTVKVICYRGQIARRELRALRTRVEQSRCRAHEIEAR